MPVQRQQRRTFGSLGFGSVMGCIAIQWPLGGVHGKVNVLVGVFNFHFGPGAHP